jgi:hypothetical protein
VRSHRLMFLIGIRLNVPAHSNPYLIHRRTIRLRSALVLILVRR